MNHRWTLAGVAVTAIAAMVSLVGIDSEQPDPLVTVLVWALGLIVVAILLNLAWTFPVFRGLVYRTEERNKAWRKIHRERRWIATVYEITDGILLEVSAPRDSDSDDVMEIELAGRGVQHTTATEKLAVEFGSRRLAYWAKYPGDFTNAPVTLPAGRYKVRWRDTTGYRRAARFKVDKRGRLRRTPRVRYVRWKRGLRDMARRREESL